MTWKVGSWMFDEASLPSWHNASFIAIDIASMVPPEQFTKRIRGLIDEIHATPTADGVDRVLLPGEREWNLYRKVQQSGITLPQDVIEKLSQAAELTGVAFPMS